MEIDFQDETKRVTSAHLTLINDLLNYTAEKELVASHAELSIIFVDNKEIQKLNNQYRNIDRPTDVLSFALEEDVDGEIEISGIDLPLILGDVIISVDKAEEQAEEYNHSFTRELGFLALHGFLHLLGYDHMEKEDEKKMFGRQEEILNGFGLSREE
ncbi:metal-dependent hydrolase [Gracilibacillus boraciitolerans JCM 21714]|uniref:Endoribonuclease YbeY n=1 Tax=Gracilibacillus boraciitolerans JCM 21714 TaxID=1298598 RepID=W4VDA5_9BACI|nr:rRNA maturation RNase YbeY [Gracilibacillus boraciitolerans]GAE91161.1 metal-dependent hydrolase [Gracilibacillus boraciitolerans JCM 21714]